MYRDDGRRVVVVLQLARSRPGTAIDLICAHLAQGREVKPKRFADGFVDDRTRSPLVSG